MDTRSWHEADLLLAVKRARFFVIADIERTCRRCIYEYRPRQAPTASQNSRTLVAPVAVAQQPLVEFSGWKPRQFRLKIDRARHFLARQRLAAERDQFLREIRPRQNPRHRLHERFYFLAEIGIGNAEHRALRDLGMGDQAVLAVLRGELDGARRDI